MPDKILIEWSAPARPYKARTREFYTTILSLAFLLGVILLLLKEFLLIGVIMAFAFLSYILATHQPENVTHQLTEGGVVTDGKVYPWSELTFYWLKVQWDQEVLYLKTVKALPGVLLLVLDPAKKAEIVKVVTDHLPENIPSDSFVDRASRWLGEKIPLENS